MKREVLTRDEAKRICWRRALAACAALALCALPAAARQQQGGATPAPPAAPAATAKQSPAKKDFTLSVSKAAPHTFKLRAKKALLTDVTDELSRRLKLPIRLSPLMAKQYVENLDISGLNLEATLRMLAPHPYVDYVAGGEDFGQPKPLAVYLYAMNERPPSLNETVKNNVSALLIEGDTEEGTEEYEKRKREKPEPLAVTFTNNRLSVRAEKQPLSVVLFKIANELGIPFELQSDTTEIVDLEFNGYTVDQAMRALSPSVRLYYRSDLLNFETYPIRIALAPPAQPAQAPNKANN